MSESTQQNDQTSTEDTTAAPAVKMFPALRLMERTCPPVRFGRDPYWRAPATGIEPFVPAWNWHTSLDFPQGTEVVTLDANGAFLGAIGSVNIAHSQLNRVGAYENHPRPREVAPGYYRISVPHWAFSATIVHPLGDSARLETEDTLWIAAPTLILLLELEEEGHIGWFEILDSFTAPVQTTFRTWAQRLRAVREECLDRVDAAHPAGTWPEGCKCAAHQRYIAFKEGYSSALSMILTGSKCATHRPDWSHTVYAQHSANMWRKAWRYTFTGAPIVSMGHVDELQVVREQLRDAMKRPQPPFRFDSTGRALGAMKIKRVGELQETIRAVPVPASAQDQDDTEDIL